MDDFEISDEIRSKLQEEQNKLIAILESLKRLSHNEDWQVLKELVFDKSLEAIERQIKSVSLMETINTDKLYKLQGEWSWCKQYSDSNRFAETIKKQLEDIKKRL